MWLIDDPLTLCCAMAGLLPHPIVIALFPTYNFMPHGPVEITYANGLLVTAVIGTDDLPKFGGERSLVAGDVYRIASITDQGNLVVVDKHWNYFPRFAGFLPNSRVVASLRNDHAPWEFSPFVYAEDAKEFFNGK